MGDENASGETKPHLSPTQLNMYWRCGQQYYHRYILGERRPPGIALVVGRSVHESVEADMLSKLQDGELLETEEITDRVRDAITGYLQGELILSDLEREEGEARTKATAVDLTVALSLLHHTDLAPTIEPDQVERGVRLVLKGHPFDIEMRLDLRDTGGHIRDTKTAARKWPQARVDTDTGLTMYHWASKTIGPPHSDDVFLDCLTKTKTPKAVTLETTRDDEDHTVALRRAVNMWEAREKGIFVPCTPDAWVCSPKFCGYFESCPYATRPRRPKT